MLKLTWSVFEKCFLQGVQIAEMSIQTHSSVSGGRRENGIPY